LPPTAPNEQGKIHILHVDDDVDHLKFTKLFLEELDPVLQIDSASSPSEGVNMLRMGSYDCVVSDYQMPEMDGVAFARWIRKWSRIPFIIYTGRGSEEVASAAFDAGIDDYIRKETDPAHYQVLARRVRTVVEGRWSEDLYRNIADGSKDSCTIIVGSRYVYANQATLDMLGEKSLDAVIGKDSVNWVADDDKEKLKQMALRRQRGEPQPRFFEFTLKRSDGTTRRVEVSASLINYRGKPASLTFARDLSERLKLLDDVKKAEAQYKLIADNMTDAVFLLNQKLIMTYLSPSATKMWGYTLEDLRDGPVTSIVKQASITENPHLTDRGGFLQKLSGNEGTPITGELEILKKDGAAFWMEISLTPIKDHEGKMAGILGVGRDVTLKKNADQSLRESEEKFRSIIEQSSEGVILIDEGGIVIEFNPGLKKIMGLDGAGIKGRKSWDLLYAMIPAGGRKPPTQEIFENMLREALSTGNARWFNNPMTTNYTEPNGTKKVLQVSFSPIKTSKGHMIVAILRDFTEETRAKEELKKSEELYRTILETSYEPISITVNDKIVYANKKRAELAGVDSLSELIGVPAMAYVHKDDWEAVQNRRDNASLKETVVYEYRTTRKDGSVRWVEDALTRINFKGEVGQLHVLHDVTDRKKYEMRLEALHSHILKLGPTTNINEVARATLEVTKNSLGLTMVNFAKVDAEKIQFIKFEDIPNTVDYVIPLRERSISTRAVKTKTSQLVNDTSLDVDYQTDSSGVVYLSELAVPVTVEGEVVALLNSEEKARGKYTEEDKRLMETIALHVRAAISRIRQMEKLLTSEEKYRNFLEYSTEAALVLVGTKIVYANRQSAAMLNYEDPSELINEDIGKIITAKYTDVIRQRTLARQKGEQQPSRYEVDLITKDGRVFTVDISATLITYDGQTAVLAFHRDITDRKRYEEQLEALHSYATRLTEADTIEAVGETALEAIDVILGFSEGGFGVIQGGSLVFVRTRGVEPSWVGSLKLDGRGITVRAAKTGETQFVLDTRLDEDYIRDSTLGSGPLSELDVPVKIDGKVIAVLNIEEREANAFAVEDRRLVELFADHVASAIKRLKHFEAERKAISSLEILHKGSEKLAEAFTEEDAYRAAIDTIEKTHPNARGHIGIVNGDQIIFDFGTSQIGKYLGPESKLVLNGRGITVRAAKTRKTQLVPDVTVDPDYVRPKITIDNDPPYKSEIAVPVILDGNVIAVLNLETIEGDTLTVDDQKLLETLTRGLASSISRIRQLKAISASEEKYRNILESSLDAAVVIVGTKIVYVNKRAAEIFGYGDVSQIINKDLGEYVHPTDYANVKARTLSRQRGEAQTSKYMIRVKRADGSFADMELSPSLITFEGKNATLAFCRDVTARVRYDEKILALHKHAAELASAEDAESVLAATLYAMKTVLGYEKAGYFVRDGEYFNVFTAPGKPYDLRLSAAGKGITMRAAREKQSIMVNDLSGNTDYVDSGKGASLSELAVPVVVNGVVEAILDTEGTLRNAFGDLDVNLMEILATHVASALERIEHHLETERREAARTRELLEGASRVSNMMRHDLKGPLQTIRSASYLVRSHPEKAGEMADAIDRSVDYASKILEDLRSTTSPAELQKTLVSINDLVEQSLKATSIPLGVEVRFVGGSDFVAASVDITRIRRVLDNLIKNALEAMVGKGVLTLRVEKAGGAAVIEVEDTGPGIKPETQVHIFEPFYTTKPLGTGLGLAYSKQAVEAHGGSISVRSEVGKGTTFVVSLPLEKVG
jgi:PAS domain S-box-containing protein